MYGFVFPLSLVFFSSKRTLAQCSFPMYFNFNIFGSEELFTPFSYRKGKNLAAGNDGSPGSALEGKNQGAQDGCCWPAGLPGLASLLSHTEPLLGASSHCLSGAGPEPQNRPQLPSGRSLLALEGIPSSNILEQVLPP